MERKEINKYITRKQLNIYSEIELLEFCFEHNLKILIEKQKIVNIIYKYTRGDIESTKR